MTKTGDKTEAKAKATLAAAADVLRIAGPVADGTIAAVLGSEPSIEELEVAGMYLRGEGSEVDRLGHPMSGKVARIYDTLRADALYADEEE